MDVHRAVHRAQADMDAGTTLHNVVTADSDESAEDTAFDDVTIDSDTVPGSDEECGCNQCGCSGRCDHYTVTVDNTGNISLTNVTVDDTLLGVGGLTYQSGDTDSDGELDVTETWTYTGQYMVPQADMDAGTTLHNVVTADSDESAEDTAFDDVTISTDAVAGSDEGGGCSQCGCSRRCDQLHGDGGQHGQYLADERDGGRHVIGSGRVDISVRGHGQRW